MNKNSKIYVAGHTGLVGSAILKKLKELKYNKIIYKTHNELDLEKQSDTFNFIKHHKPQFIFIAAAKVGGILANNSFPADFIYQNLNIQNNLIYAAYKYNVKKILFLGSSCIYPKNSKQPIKEEYLLSDKLEPTNEPYAIAKIAGIKLCQSLNRQFNTNFIAAMPTNLYGENDNFHPQNSHVIPALIQKFHNAKINKINSVTLWGSGKPLREFLHANDLANACIFLMNKFNPSKNDNINGNIFLNVGTQKEITIKELAEKIKSIVKYNGNIIWDKAKPDGSMRKLLDINKIHKLGWKANITLTQGIKNIYQHYSKQI